MTVMSKSLLAVLLSISFTSCATMFSGTKADIFIDGDVKEPVTINSTAGEYKDVTLPTLVEVKRRQLNGQHIHISSEHHYFDDIVLEKSLNAWALVSVLMYGPPFLVDLMTNAVSKPKYDQFYIMPLDSVSMADSLHRLRPAVLISTMGPDTRARLRRQRLPAKFSRHEFNATLGVGPNQADHFTKRYVDDFIIPMNMETDAECGNIFRDSYLIGKMEYHYRLNRKWDIGAVTAWGKSTESYIEKDYYMKAEHQQNLPDTTTYGYSNCRSFSFAPSVRYTWYETRTYRLFSRLSLGLMRHHLQFDTEDWKCSRENKPYRTLIKEENFDKLKWRMAYQFSPIGISVGAGPLRLVAELGYGYLGVCNVGLGFSF